MKKLETFRHYADTAHFQTHGKKEIAVFSYFERLTFNLAAGGNVKLITAVADIAHREGGNV
jgi:hypothetical protein